MDQLRQAEIDTYRERGLVIPQKTLSDRLYNKIRITVETVIEKVNVSRPDFMLIAHVPIRPGLDDGVPHGEEIFDIATDPEILDFVEAVLGPDIILWGSSIFAKPPGVGKKVQWHQDSRWWPMRPMSTCTMWIAIDESTPENGCLRYIPGSHAWDIMPHLDEAENGLLGSSIAENLIDLDKAQDIILKPRQFSMHQANIVHGSEPNVSTKRRAGLVLRYMPATSLFDRTDAAHLAEVGVMKTGDVPQYGHRPIWLVRGNNLQPQNDFVRGHKGLEDLDAIADRRREDHAKERRQVASH